MTLKDVFKVILELIEDCIELLISRINREVDRLFTCDFLDIKKACYVGLISDVKPNCISIFGIWISFKIFYLKKYLKHVYF